MVVLSRLHYLSEWPRESGSATAGMVKSGARRSICEVIFSLNAVERLYNGSGLALTRSPDPGCMRFSRREMQCPNSSLVRWWSSQH